MHLSRLPLATLPDPHCNPALLLFPSRLLKVYQEPEKQSLALKARKSRQLGSGRRASMSRSGEWLGLEVMNRVRVGPEAQNRSRHPKSGI